MSGGRIYELDGPWPEEKPTVEQQDRARCDGADPIYPLEAGLGGNTGQRYAHAWTIGRSNGITKEPAPLLYFAHEACGWRSYRVD